MPMATNEEHGAQNPNNPYCIHCTDMKGKLLPFEKKFEELVKTAMDTRWMNREQAEKHVLTQMAELPAWRDRGGKMKPEASISQEALELVVVVWSCAQAFFWERALKRKL